MKKKEEQGAYRSAGFVHHADVPFYSTERLSAFRHVMKRNRLETAVFPDGGDIRAWVRELQKPAAVMAASDIRAADQILACRKEGISVPNQIAVVQKLDFLFRHPNFRGRLREMLIPANHLYRIYKRHFGHTLRQVDV